MKKKWEKIGYVLASKNRVEVLKLLSQRPMTPKELSRKTGLYLSHVSLAIKELVTSGLVHCLSPDLKRGRIYGVTPSGRQVLSEVNARSEAGQVEKDGSHSTKMCN